MGDSPTTTLPEPAFALVDASGLIDPMSVRRYSTTVEIYAGMRRLENQGGFRIIPVINHGGKERWLIPALTPDRRS